MLARLGLARGAGKKTMYAMTSKPRNVAVKPSSPPKPISASTQNKARKAIPIPRQTASNRYAPPSIQTSFKEEQKEQKYEHVKQKPKLKIGYEGKSENEYKKEC